MKIDVLDYGFVRSVESWGGGDYEQDMLEGEREAGIIEAARQSTQGSFRGWDTDKRLLKFLFENKHATPFEFAGCILEIKAPLFVFREWQRHRTQSYNEMSARYAPLPNENYMPTIDRLIRGSVLTANKQAGAIKDAPVLTEETATKFQNQLHRTYEDFEYDYQTALKFGVPKEVARCGMPVGRYSQMRASANLRNWLAFLTLRLDPHAQWEIRQYAKAVAELIRREFPKTFSLFEKSNG